MSSFTGFLSTRWLDDDLFQVLDPYRFDYGEEGSGVGYFVQEGTISDLMSLPKPIRVVVARTTSGSIASIPHDIAYKTGEMMTYTVNTDDADDPTPAEIGKPFKINRSTADLMFLDALLTRKMNKIKAYTIYLGLVGFGWITWNKYRKMDKKSG